MFAGASPTLEATHIPAGIAPPSPPFSAQSDPLDDIYGSEPASPVPSPHAALNGTEHSHTPSHEILSDLPSRQRALDTDAYREGLSNSKGQYVQEGFDEGYSLGANLGQRVGFILGVLQGLVAATTGQTSNGDMYKQAQGWWESAQKELAIQELLGREWVDEEGIWKWEVRGEEEQPTFREVADQHPTIRRWMEKVKDVAREWSVDLHALEREDDDGED
jgi:hypothetical protein